MRLHRLGFLVAVLGLVATWAHVGNAQQQDNALLQQIQSQEQRIAQMEALLTQREQPFQVQPASWNYESIENRMDALEAAIAGGGEKYGDPWVDTHDQKWRSKWGGRVMLDYYNFFEQDRGAAVRYGDMQDYFEARRIWLEFAGHGYGVYDYKVQLDFEPERLQNTFGDVEIRDLYIGIDHIPLLGYVRIGNFWEPIGMEQNTGPNYITFMERSFVNKTFARDRRVGICAFNGNKLRSINWAGGMFFQDINPKAKERVDDAQGVDLVGRIWVSPFHDCEGRHVLHAGVSALYSRNRNNRIPTFEAKPEYHENSPTVAGIVPAHDTFRMGLEGAAVWGPASLQAEWFYIGSNQPNTSFYGAYAYASYFLTGENRVYNRRKGAFGCVKPLENFWIVDTPGGGCIGSGAWEIAARWSWADMADSDLIAGQGLVASDFGVVNAFTLGVNWYWNPHARMMFNYIQGWGDYPLPSNVNMPPASLETNYEILAASVRFDF